MNIRIVRSNSRTKCPYCGSMVIETLYKGYQGILPPIYWCYSFGHQF